MVINKITKQIPIKQDHIPERMESSPKVGPTVLSSIIFTGAGKAPARKTVERSLASSVLKLPSITALPSGILVLMVGADCTTPYKTIAKFLLILSSVTLEKIFAPSGLNSIETSG